MTYPTEVGPAARGGKVASVEPGGPADRAGLRPGDLITRVEGDPLRDVIDWMWLADGTAVALEVESVDGAAYETIVGRKWDEPWGLNFDGVVFDGIRECDNACAFCFVSQLPPGMRRSLSVRDDDYRLSFLAGNFVTLTNLDDDDIDRVIDQHLSPLHVSLHAVSPEVRRSLICPTAEDRALEYIDTLLEEGIELHVQVVLVPGVNDGVELERTLAWLWEREGVQSVGLVPVGVTRFQRRVTATYDTPEACAAVLSRVEAWAARAREDRGSGWVYAADELYLAAGEPLPSWDDYDDFPQFENGIGMARAFVDEVAAEVDALGWASTEAGAGAVEVSCSVVLVTGELFAPVLASLAPELEAAGCAVRVLPVANSLLGGNVNVAGLLGGADLSQAIGADACAHAGARDIYLVPDVTVNDDGLLLDDLTIARVAEDTGADVRLIESDAAGLVSALRELSSTTGR